MLPKVFDKISLVNMIDISCRIIYEQTVNEFLWTYNPQTKIEDIGCMNYIYLAPVLNPR